LIKIYSAADITEAHIVRGMLEAHGIEAHVGGHYLQGGVGELAAMDFASVHVENEFEQDARKIVEQYENNAEKPDNRSVKTNYSFWFALVIWIVIALLVYISIF